MAKLHATFEITNDKIRMVTGYVIDNEPVVIYSASKEIKGCVRDNQIINKEGVILAIKQLAFIQSPVIRAKMKISEATIILPPLGFRVYSSRKTTNVVSSSSSIDEIDVNNVINLVSKDNVEHDSSIVDIIPTYFKIEGDKKYSKPPLGAISNTLEVSANVHTLPTHIINEYRDCFLKADVKVVGMAVSTYCLSEYAKKNPAFPKSYILIDMGHAMTSFGCIGNYEPYGSHVIAGGFDGLIRKVSVSFGVSEEKAVELLNLYGLDHRETSFHPYIATSTDEEGRVSKFNQENLNIIITSYLDEYFAKFNSPMEIICKLTGNDTSKAKLLPIVFTGSFIRIPGVKEYIKDKFFTHVSVHFLRSTTIGASKENYCACVGGLLIANNKNGSLSANNNKVGPLTRS